MRYFVLNRLVMVVGIAAALAAPAIAEPRKTCGSLAELKIDNVAVLSATSVTVSADTKLPPYCRVSGSVDATRFEVRLPLENWNGKFYMVGCNIFCGRPDSDAPGFTNAMNHGLKRNYAVATMDSGHESETAAKKQGFPESAAKLLGSGAHDNLAARKDWGYRAVTETARVAKAVIRTFYDKPQEEHLRSYFAGGYAPKLRREFEPLGFSV